MFIVKKFIAAAALISFGALAQGTTGWPDTTRLLTRETYPGRPEGTTNLWVLTRK